MRFALAALVACSSLALVACSEPVPQSPDAAFWLQSSQDDPKLCPIVGQVATIGTIDQNNKQTRTDGDQGTTVSCQVIGDASPYSAHGKMDDGVNYLEVEIPSLTDKASKDSPAKGSLTFAAVWTASNPYSGECDFYFEPNTREGVGTGRFWVSFECAALNYSQYSCPLKKGYAVFENCSTEDTSL